MCHIVNDTEIEDGIAVYSISTDQSWFMTNHVGKNRLL